MLKYWLIQPLSNFFFDKYLNKLETNILIMIFFLIWIFEWIFMYNYILSFNTYVSLFYPYSISVFLLVTFLYFMYMWGISVWKSTQFGKFTSGDSKLWVKGFASFWVFELSTLLGLIMAAAWMNWGPVPLMPSKFNMSKKSFLMELTFFTYALWVLYLMRFSMKWNKWKNQMFLTMFMLLMIFYLMWSDILLMVGSDNITVNNGASWKFIKVNIIAYSLAPNWWTMKFMNYSAIMSKDSIFFSLDMYMKNLKMNNDTLMQNNENILMTYEKYYYLNMVKLDLNYSNLMLTVYSDLYYPSSVGFLTKSMSMWTFFLFLKMWHHIMLYMWWFFYLISLFSSKKNSYQLLSICHFNMYCCFLIILAMYIYCLFPKFIMFFSFFKDSPKMISIVSMYSWKYFIVDYFMSLSYSSYLDLFNFKNNSFFIMKHNKLKNNYNSNLTSEMNIIYTVTLVELNFVTTFKCWIHYKIYGVN